MAILKCKMCGGDIELAADKTFGICEFCGNTMTLPKIDDDQRLAAFNRGNHFRRIGEFDKALAVYERIVQEDDTDAEAHWCCALCRFGIEYVEDPDTLEWYPTCHRASFDSFLEDVDYRAALEYSDGITRRQYAKDGARIAEVQRGILAASQNSEPYDVFICYKESDENGDRTRDSLMAQDIYYQLTEQGRKVFFARITLEDVAGAQYEPYIFAALNSARVMIVVGTRPDYLNAVWVKNEWSRFLALMKKDRQKLLLPCYRDMDPYEMPEALSVLQSYDMSKIGFIQDLTRGIAKVLDVQKKPEPVRETVVVQQTGGAGIAPLLKRAFIFLEDGNWESADEYCEKVLDADPECAMAYVGKLMCELRVRMQPSLADCPEPFDDRNHYRKAIRFGDEALRETLEGYIRQINNRNENARKAVLYEEACLSRDQAGTESEYQKAAMQFAAIGDFQDAPFQAEKCMKMAEGIRMDGIYSTARARMCKHLKEGTYEERRLDFQNAIEIFRTIPGWRDAEEQIAFCFQKMEELDAEEARKKQAAAALAEEKARRNNRNIILAAVLICALLVVRYVVTYAVVPAVNYRDAVALMESGAYTEAIAAFEAMGGYRDSAAQIEACRVAIRDREYDGAVALLDAGKYTEAIAAFEAMDGYRDSKVKIAVCQTEILDDAYDGAAALLNAGLYTQAMEAFEDLGGYRDSEEQIEACRKGIYDDAAALLEAGNVVEAYELLWLIDGYEDSAEIAAGIFDEYMTRIMKQVQEGDIIRLGTYEQDNDPSNGAEPIEWLVLDIRGGKALLISRYALDSRPYHTEGVGVTWETCSLRNWLNQDFWQTAFSEAEKAWIPETRLSADRTHPYYTNAGKTTKDRVFLLSVKEAKDHIRPDQETGCMPTEYAAANGVCTLENGNCLWWLRTPGTTQLYAAFACKPGGEESAEFFVDLAGSRVTSDNRAVRPALWVNLK